MSNKNVLGMTLDDFNELMDGESFDGYEVVWEGPWEQDYKYQHKKVVFKYNGKYYQIMNSRSGSSFTDWYYSSEDWRDEDIEINEVEKYEEVVVRWRLLK